MRADPEQNVSLPLVAPEPALRVWPPVIDFGEVPEGETRVAMVRLMNTGRGDTALVAQVGGKPEWMTLHPSHPITLRSGQREKLELRVKPPRGESSVHISEAVLVIAPADAPADAEINPNLRAELPVRCGCKRKSKLVLLETANPVQLGDVPQGETATRTLRFAKDDNAPVDLDDPTTADTSQRPWVDLKLGDRGLTQEVHVTFHSANREAREHKFELAVKDPETDPLAVEFKVKVKRPPLLRIEPMRVKQDLPQGQERTIEFVIANDGDDELVVSRVEGANEWLLVEGAGAIVVKPRDSHRLRVRLNGGVSAGAHHGILRVVTNDEGMANRETRVPIEVNVLPPKLTTSVRCLTASGTVRQGKKLRFAVTVGNEGGGVLEGQFKDLPLGVEVKQRQFSLRPGEHMDVVAVVSGGFDEVGEKRTPLFLETNDPGGLGDHVIGLAYQVLPPSPWPRRLRMLFVIALITAGVGASWQSGWFRHVVRNGNSSNLNNLEGKGKVKHDIAYADLIRLLTPGPGEIKLRGELRSVENDGLVLAVHSFRNPSGRVARLADPKDKRILISRETKIYSARRKADTRTLKVGSELVVTGKDLGSGQPLPARVVSDETDGFTSEKQ